jgi:hypothetical protein
MPAQPKQPNELRPQIGGPCPEQTNYMKSDGFGGKMFNLRPANIADTENAGIQSLAFDW